LADVAVCGGYVMEAGRRLGAAVALHGPAFARSRGMSGLKLATLALHNHEPDRAAASGCEALTSLGAVRSARVKHVVGELGRAARPYGDLRIVTDLRDRIHQALESW
ncbi:MAG: hypothetical protein ACRCYQ_15795, partial [Nocardioides sp.]